MSNHCRCRAEYYATDCQLLSECQQACGSTSQDATDTYPYRNPDPTTKQCVLYNPDTYKIWPYPDLTDINKTWSNFRDAPKDSVTAPEYLEDGTTLNTYGLCTGDYADAVSRDPMNEFNWIISTCRGKDCASWDQWRCEKL
jgi:hypothetical protein